MGASRKARGRRLGRHLHARQSRLSPLAHRRAGERSTSSITGSISRAFPRRRSARRRPTARSRSSRSGARWRRRAMPTCCARSRSLGDDRDWRFEHAGGGRAVRAAEGAGGKARHRGSDHLARSAGPRLHLRHAEARRPLRAPLAPRPLRRPRRAAERADGGAGLRACRCWRPSLRHSRAGDARQDRLARRRARPAGARRRDAAADRRRGSAAAPREAGAKSVREKFSSEPGIDFVAAKLKASRAGAKAA